MPTRWWPPAVNAASSSAAATLNVTTHYYWEAKDKIAAGEVGAVQSIDFYQGSGTQLSGGGCQIFGLTRLFAGDADVDWITGWVATDPWSEYDQGGAGYIRFVNGVEAFLHRRITGRHGFEVLCDPRQVHQRQHDRPHVYPRPG